ncbi:hypothetical protein [Kordiimonas pumila]|uniref:Septum formation initiator n=1 Tax=Kordiimonas pumila TaxID=2161677 RepID=A0ABV7D0W0_9PROT|nr:hypothetical protein [Kordiimonas pumila]
MTGDIKPEQKPPENSLVTKRLNGKYIAFGIIAGAPFGVVLGHISMGIVVGLLVGIAVAYAKKG